MIDKEEISIIDKKIVIVSSEINHIKALRYKVYDKININEYVIEITKINNNTLLGNILGFAEKKGEPKISITLVQSYLKSDKMEFVLQKAVELGVSKFLPVISKNTVVKLDEKDRIKKKERLVKIAKEAIMQCGRTDIVEIQDVKNISEIDFSIYSKVIICYEDSKKDLRKEILNIKQKISEDDMIAVVVGPEGGFDKTEIDTFLKQKNVIDVLFGERILRAETASMYILSILDYELN